MQNVLVEGYITPTVRYSAHLARRDGMRDHLETKNFATQGRLLLQTSSKVPTPTPASLALFLSPLSPLMQSVVGSSSLSAVSLGLIFTLRVGSGGNEASVHFAPKSSELNYGIQNPITALLALQFRGGGGAYSRPKMAVYKRA